MLVRDLIRKYRSPWAVTQLLARCGYDWVSRKVLGCGNSMTDVRMSKNALLLRLLWFLHRSVQCSQDKSKASQVQAWLSAGDLVYDLAKVYAHELILFSVVENFGMSSNSEVFSLMALNDCEMCHQY